MPPRRRLASESLTADDLASLNSALAEGRRATVYLREGTPSLGLAPGASARVIAISGTTLTIKPRGVDDELPYEADELRMTKDAPAQPAKAAKVAKPAAAKKAAQPRPAAAPKTDAAAAQIPVTAAAPKTAARPAKRAAGRKAPSSVTVTVFGSADNEWSVSVTRGGRKPTRSRSVAADSVESAMRELGDDAALEAALSVLNAAREEAQRRVEELSRELEAARRALAALEGQSESE
ncbi:DUF6319 family protein [Gordonia sp. PS3]|uniref:DUF6319 family protein n=1 Tax=Gordonia sp. PS3 TaxID=3248841 RepID=UPI0035C00513